MPTHTGFNQPITLDVRVPEGPPEYKAGWHGGCRSAMGTRSFANSFIYEDKKGGASLSNGIYQHDPVFQSGWAEGWFSCNLHIGTFVNYTSMRHGPLEQNFYKNGNKNKNVIELSKKILKKIN